MAAGEELRVKVTVSNTGSVAGDEVVQLYLSDLQASVEVPLRHLEGVQRVHLKPGQIREVEFTVSPRQMALIDEEGRCILEPGRFRVSVGGSQPDERSRALTGQGVLSAEFELTGEREEIPY